jgi:hypothetical protein
MRLKLTPATGTGLALMLGGLYLSFTRTEAFLDRRVFMTLVGILAWIIGHRLVEL